MAKTLSDEQVRRIKEFFHQLLGRDLSPDEQRYPGLSSIVVSIGELELNECQNERRNLKLVNEN